MSEMETLAYMLAAILDEDGLPDNERGRFFRFAQHECPGAWETIQARFRAGNIVRQIEDLAQSAASMKMLADEEGA